MCEEAEKGICGGNEKMNGQRGKTQCGNIKQGTLPERTEWNKPREDTL
jgi:hypothetical protein